MTDRHAEALARRYERYAIKFCVDSTAEPTDANLRAVLGRCVRPARDAEFPEIRNRVRAYRAEHPDRPWERP